MITEKNLKTNQSIQSDELEDLKCLRMFALNKRESKHLDISCRIYGKGWMHLNPVILELNIICKFFF